MAIDLTGKIQPAFGTDATADTTCTQIRGNKGHTIKILADGIIYLFNGIDDGEAAPAAASLLELSAAEAAQGYVVTLGERLEDLGYATVCIAAKAGTVNLRVSSEVGAGRLYR